MQNEMKQMDSLEDGFGVPPPRQSKSATQEHVHHGGIKATLHRPHLRAGYVDPALVSGRKLRAAILGRKSHATEGKSKSVREQIAECQQVCEVMGFELSDERMYIEADGTEGSWWWPDSGRPGPHRPELGRLLRDIEDGLIDVLVIWRSDRLYRDVGLAHELLNLMVKHNVRLVASRHDYHIHTATGLANAKQEAVRNEEMLGKTSEDIIRDLQFKKAIGQITRSPACLGFRSAGNDTHAAVIIPDEIEVVRRIFRMYVVGEDDRGPLCRNAIAMQLMSEGIKFPRLRRADKGEHLEIIEGSRIERILRHVAYVGKMRHAGEDYDCDQLLVPASDGSGRKETVVPLALWQAANDKLDRETKADKRFGTKAGDIPHLLTGSVGCGVCGRNVYAAQGKIIHGEQVTPTKLQCINFHGPNKCPRDLARRAPQEAEVERWVFAELFPVLAAETEITRLSAGRDVDVQRLTQLREAITKAENDERRKLRRALDAVDEGHMDNSQYGQLAADLRAEREALGREAELLEQRLARAAPNVPDFTEETVKSLPRATVRAAIQASLEWIALCADGVVAKTRWGTYTAARYRRPNREAGEHHSTFFIAKATVVDSLEALTFFPDLARFIKGRRHVLGDRADTMSDEQIVPGCRVLLAKEEHDDQAEYLPEIVLAAPLRYK